MADDDEVNYAVEVALPWNVAVSAVVSQTWPMMHHRFAIKNTACIHEYLLNIAIHNTACIHEYLLNMRKQLRDYHRLSGRKRKKIMDVRGIGLYHYGTSES